MGPPAARDPQIPLGQAVKRLALWWRRERAIAKVIRHLETTTGRHITRDEALRALDRWRERNPRKDPRLH